MKNLNTCKLTSIFLMIWMGWMVLPDLSAGQFLRLTFEIESELEAEEIQSLRFGEVVPNSGRIRITRGDPDMGTYAITGMQNLMVDLTLELPDFLEMRGGEEDFRVPLELEVSYANRNENNLDHAIEITGTHVRFPLRADAPHTPSPDQPVPTTTAFIYVYGDIEVGDIPPGTYEAEVYMAIEYE